MAMSLWLHFFDSPCTCTHEMINTAFTPQPQSITALWHLGYCGVFNGDIGRWTTSCYSDGSDSPHCCHCIYRSIVFTSWRQYASPSNTGLPGPTHVLPLKGLLQLRFEHDSSTIRARFEHDTSTTRYNMLRGFSCARIRDRFEHFTRISSRRVLHVDWQLNAHNFYFFYLYRPTLHRVCEYARNCLYKRN